MLGSAWQKLNGTRCCAQTCIYSTTHASTAGRALENEEAEPLVRDELAQALAGPLATDRARQKTQVPVASVYFISQRVAMYMNKTQWRLQNCQ